MKYISQFFIIVAFSFAGEALRIIIPLPIPASIYGMVLLFVFLLLKIIKLEWVRETGKFLVEIMPIMFIPAGVGLMTTWGVLKPILIPVIIITVVTNITVMFVTGKVSQGIIKVGKKGQKEC